MRAQLTKKSMFSGKLCRIKRFFQVFPAGTKTQKAFNTSVYAYIMGKSQLPSRLLLPFFRFSFSSSLLLHLISFHFLPLYSVLYVPFNSQPTSSNFSNKLPPYFCFVVFKFSGIYISVLTKTLPLYFCTSRKHCAVCFAFSPRWVSTLAIVSSGISVTLHPEMQQKSERVTFKLTTGVNVCILFRHKPGWWHA